MIFLDEIDSLLQSWLISDHDATAVTKAQFMSLWGGLDTDYNCQVIVMGATNHPQDLGSAIMRRTRSTSQSKERAPVHRPAAWRRPLLGTTLDVYVRTGTMGHKRC